MNLTPTLRCLACVTLLLSLFAPLTRAQSNYEFVRNIGGGQLDSPSGITIDSSGNIFVADGGIVKFDKNGNIILQFGTFGSGNGQFQSPSGIAIDSSGNIFVSDTNNHRIQKFDKNGNYLLQLCTQGSSNGQLNNPHGVAVDSSGNIYVADTGNHRIQKFSKTGVYLIKFGVGQLNSPYGITIDGTGNIFVSDTGNNRIQKFDKNGDYLLQFGVGYHSEGVMVDASSNIFIADNGNNNHRIVQFSPAGTAIAGAFTFIGLLSNSAPQNVTFTFRPDDSSANVTQVIPIAVDSSYAVSGLPSKAGVMHIKADKYLAANVTIDLTTDNMYNVNATLNPGDANNDNIVDIGDFGALVGVYGDTYAIGDVNAPAADVAADFDGNGTIDINDFGLLLNSFGSVGDM